MMKPVADSSDKCLVIQSCGDGEFVFTIYVYSGVIGELKDKRRVSINHKCLGQEAVQHSQDKVIRLIILLFLKS